MKTNDLKLPEQLTLHAFDSRDALAESLADALQQRLQQAIARSGKASLALSGGSTPRPLLATLGRRLLDWSKLTLTLVDERWVPPSDSASNQRLIEQHLVSQLPQQSQLVGFWHPDCQPETALERFEQQLRPHSTLTCTVLGMGNDGHTASLFPCSAQLEWAMHTDKRACLVQPNTAPHTRLSLSLNEILNSEQRILHICGEDKLVTLQQALTNMDPMQMPVTALFDKPLSIYWAP